MKFKYLLLAAAAMLTVASCDEEKIDNTGNDQGGNQATNYWYIHGNVAKGIKSINNDGYVENYDSEGRLKSFVSEYGSNTYTYNSDGLVTSIVTVDRYDNQEHTSTQTFEYNNAGKFCPFPMSPGQVFHIYENGLVPNLSKVTWTYDDEDPTVMEFKFKDDKLTISTTGSRTMLDGNGDLVDMPYDDIIFEYTGNYPNKCSQEHEFLGPMTYMDNGMFATYVEGFYSWDPQYPNFVTLERTRTVNKNFKDRMLTEKEVNKWYNEGEASPYDIETIVFTYNEHGDEIKEEVTHTSADSDHIIVTYEYEYDSKGNWTKVTVTNNNLNYPDSEPNVWSSEREIVYY